MKLKCTDDPIYITREMVEDAAYIPEWAHRRLRIYDFKKEKQDEDSISSTERE